MIGLQLNPWSAKVNHLNFTNWKLCLATTTYNFQWVKINHIDLMLEHTFENADVQAMYFR